MTAGKMHGAGVRSIGLVAACSGLILGATLAGAASAGSLKVNPVQISLPADRQSVSLKMTNSDAAPVSVRVTPYSWTQANGRDVYTATGNVIVSPPIFTIPAGTTQLVRIGLRQRSGAGAYRIIFEEIPRDRPADGQIQISLRLNLPLYVLPKSGGKADVSWTAWRDSAGEMVVEGRNRGSLHQQVHRLAADQAGTRTILSSEMGVVLPGSARQWKIARGSHLAMTAPFVLGVKGPAGETQSQIILERR